jgi:hypothetical protein
MRTNLLLPLALCFSIGTSGCIKSMLTNGQIASTRKASPAFQTLGDYDLARTAAMAGMVQFEGMHKLAPENEDAMFMLMSGWTGYGLAFAEDDMEAAIDAGDDDLAEYHKKRAKMAYDRGNFYGMELLKQEDEGFEAAKKNNETLRAWLNEHFDDPEDAGLMYWFGGSWLLRVNLMKEDPVYVADLFIGVAFLEHSMKLDPTFAHYGAMSALATYHSRASMAELDQGQKMFEEALAKTQRKNLMVQLNYGAKYACIKGDRALYEKLLNEVLAAEDPDPEQRLPNTIAKRRAKRYLGRQRMMDCGFDMSAPSAAPAAAPAK